MSDGFPVEGCTAKLGGGCSVGLQTSSSAPFLLSGTGHCNFTYIRIRNVELKRSFEGRKWRVGGGDEVAVVYYFPFGGSVSSSFPLRALLKCQYSHKRLSVRDSR